MKRLICVLGLYIFLGCASSQEYIQTGVDFSKYNRLAVLPLADYPTHPGSGAQVADILSIALLRQGINVIDRSQTLALLNEQDMGLFGVLDAKTAPQVGKLLGVQCILTGSINEWQWTSTNVQVVGGGAPAYVVISAAGISLKLVDCETGQIIWAASSRGSAYGENLMARAAQKAVNDVTEKLAAHFR